MRQIIVLIATLVVALLHNERSTFTSHLALGDTFPFSASLSISLLEQAFAQFRLSECIFGNGSALEKWPKSAAK